MFLYLLLIIFVLCCLHVLFNYNEKALLMRKIPGFKECFIIGNMLEIILPPEKLFQLGRQIAKENNGIYGFWSFPVAAINIYNPEDVEVILSGMKYHQKSHLYKFLKPWLRDGLLLSNGKKWQDRRKILTPAFHFNILRRYFVSFEANTNRLVDGLYNILNKEVDIIPIISESALYNICESAMGTRLNDGKTGSSYKDAVHEVGDLLGTRFARIYLHSDFLFSLSSIGRQQKHFLSIIHNFSKKVINDRKSCVTENLTNINDILESKNEDKFTISHNKKKNAAMLDLLLLAEKDGLIDRAGIQEEVDTFMFEGHDTTASGLIFCLMLIAIHQEVQENIVKELRDIFRDTKRATTIEDLASMRYLERCIKESMRLYPPVPFISRMIDNTVQLSNYTVPAGTYCNIHIYDLHRQEDIYPNAENFDPDRFLPENSMHRHSYAYIPFSAGPRNCIGQKFAMMQMKTTISAILRKFKMLPVTQRSDLRLRSDLVLRNLDPVYVNFVEREQAI